MFNSNSYNFGSQQGHATLHRETTEDLSKMYTTLYDMEDPAQQQEYTMLQQQSQQIFQHSFTDVFMSPASPASDCFSSSSSTSSGSPSPFAAMIRSMDVGEADDLAECFNITIEDLLSGDSIVFDYPEGLNGSPEDFDLFEPQEQSTITSDMHSPYHHNHHNDQRLSTSGGPMRSGSMSPIMNSSPYTAAHKKINKEEEASMISLLQAHLNPKSAEHFSSIPNSPAMASTNSPSASTCPSPELTSISPSATTSTTIDSDGMTIIKNEDGSIMVYNPTTATMTFRCELCPNESFGRVHDLKRHQVSKHKEATWPCEFCHRPFARRDALLRHYTVKAQREDGVHPTAFETEKLLQARANA
ncbi:hypothetical protein BGZ49_010268, partial [Haplosporangium sp. Z 27]